MVMQAGYRFIDFLPCIAIFFAVILLFVLLLFASLAAFLAAFLLTFLLSVLMLLLFLLSACFLTFFLLFVFLLPACLFVAFNLFFLSAAGFSLYSRTAQSFEQAFDILFQLLKFFRLFSSAIFFCAA